MPLEVTTIAAISTPLAMGGIGVIRLSGPRAIEIASSVFRTVSGASLLTAGGYTAHYGHACEGGEDIDEAIATVFRAPKSYTGEDVAEISCHGGLYLLQRTLQAVFHAGAQPAAAGEFTRRAFLNGKMSLTQAEAVMDLISAQGEQAARSALAAHDGALFRKISLVKEELLGMAAHLSAWVDYPEDEIPEITAEQMEETLSSAKQKLENLLSTFNLGRVVREGVETAIIGRPNVGKSTLMNLLAGTQRSIVTAVPGTTRDVVEDTVHVGGVVLCLADTAGIHDTTDLIESMGVDLARKRLASAQLVLAVFDSSDELSQEDKDLMHSLRARPAIAVVNKSDLPRHIDLEAVKAEMEHVVLISAAAGQGVEELSECIQTVLGLSQFDSSSALLANERQRSCALRAFTAVKEAQSALQSGVTFDAVNVCMDEAISALLELTGEHATQAVVSEVFSRFCVGK